MSMTIEALLDNVRIGLRFVASDPSPAIQNPLKSAKAGIHC